MWSFAARNGAHTVRQYEDVELLDWLTYVLCCTRQRTVLIAKTIVADWDAPPFLEAPLCNVTCFINYTSATSSHVSLIHNLIFCRTFNHICEYRDIMYALRARCGPPGHMLAMTPDKVRRINIRTLDAFNLHT